MTNSVVTCIIKLDLNVERALSMIIKEVNIKVNVFQAH